MFAAASAILLVICFWQSEEIDRLKKQLFDLMVDKEVEKKRQKVF